MNFKKIKKINFKTKELVEIYDSLKEACKNNKVSAFNLKLSYDDLRFLQKENVCRPVSLDKRILLAKKYLTINEFLFYHDLTMQELADYVGSKKGAISHYKVKTTRMNKELFKNFLALGINPYLIREYRNAPYVEDHEQTVGMEGSFVNELLESGRKKVKCITKEEAKLLGFEFKLRGVSYEIYKKGIYFYVKFESGNKDEDIYNDCSVNIA